MNDPTDISLAEYRAGNFNRAIQFAQYALARDEEDAQAWRCLGRALTKTCQWAGAMDAFENASLLQPLDNQDRISLAIAYGAMSHRSLSRDLLMSIANSEVVEVSELLQVANGLEAIDEPRLAMEACRQAGKRAPDLPEVHYQMGHYAQQCGHPVSVCEALLCHAIDLEPCNIHYRIGLASLLMRLARKREAITVIKPLLPAKLDEVTCLCCLKRIANLFFDNDDLHLASLCAQRITRLNASSLNEARSLHTPSATPS